MKQVPFNTLISYTPITHQPIRTIQLPSSQEQIGKIKASRLAAIEALLASQDRGSRKPPCFKEYQIGDQVQLEGTNLKWIEGTPKLSPRQYRPFRVATKISYIAYKLCLPKMWKIHNVFHASLLTPYCETPEHGPNFPQLAPDVIDNNPEWEVGRIMKQRTFRRWWKKQSLQK